jgi:glycosyltransferase involved in cell wall biosynthesis
MLGSLKGYKGTKEFIELASRMKEYNFELIINDSEENIRSYIKRNSIDIPENITVHPRQDNVVKFYNRATVVLNLSNKKQFVETFGLTALEAMTAGLPVIVPTVGGIAEMVEDGLNGYKIDVQELDAIEEKLKEILKNKDLFIYLANNAKKCSERYTADRMTDSIEHLIQN